MANKAVARETGIPESTIRAAKSFYHWGDTMKWPIARIRRDGGTQSRSSIPAEFTDRYAEDMQRGDIFPPIDVFHDGENYWLANGFIRVSAAEKLKLTEIEIKVHQGTLRDAQLFSFQANCDHGCRRTDDDIDRAIVAMLTDPEWSKWSNREIARRCHTSEKTVRRMRTKLKETHCGSAAVCLGEPITYINGDGDQATMVVNDAELDARIRGLLEDPRHASMGNNEIALVCGTNAERVRRLRKKVEVEAKDADRPPAISQPSSPVASGIEIPSVSEEIPFDPVETYEPPADAWSKEIVVECEATPELHDDCRDSLQDEVTFFNVIAPQIAALSRQANVALTQYRPPGFDARPAGPFASLVIALLKASNPKKWKACRGCRNSVGLAKGFAMHQKCEVCNGFGFTI